MGFTASNEPIPIPQAPAPTDLVSIPLSEIQRIRDELARLRHYHFMIGRLHGQVAGLYQRLASTVQHPTPTSGRN